jgi:methionyl-tRNA formyltransferase
VRVVFWGTPEFAVPSLRALLGEGHDVVAVVTQPDRPAGRGRAMRASAVKRVAEEEHIPLLQPEKPVGDTFLARLRSLDPEISVVVAYGQILRREVLDVPARGSVNLHASLLPELRGAAPINWAIAQGRERSGITVIRMVEKMDAGPMLMQVAEPIGAGETASDLADRLSEIGAETLVETLALLEVDAIEEIEQDDSRVTFAPRLTRAHARVDWSRSATEVDWQIRAFDAVPGAWSELDGEALKLFRPEPEPEHAHRAEPGTLLDLVPEDPARGMRVACGTGAAWIREVTPAGRKRMLTADWLRGRDLEPGVRLA